MEGADFDRRLYLLNLGLLPLELVFRIFGSTGGEPSIATASLVAALVLWVGGFSAIVLWRYRKLTITR